MTETIQELTTINSLAKQLDRSVITLWRWRKAGWLEDTEIINIAGKPYITRAGLERFYARAKAGEFAQAVYTRTPPKSQAATGAG